MAKRDLQDAIGSRLKMGKKTQQTPKPERCGISTKMNLSVYPQDWNQVNELRRYVFEQLGEPVTNSEIVRAALRMTKGSKDFIDKLKEIRPEDGRRRSH